MRKLCEYKFKNNKSISVEFLTEKETKRKFRNDCDSYALVFKTGDKRDVTGLRPDEIMILISLLSYSIYATTKAYDLEILKGYNGFGFRK